MSKRPPPLALSLLALSLLPACADDPALEHAPEGSACELTEPVRLAAAPDGFLPLRTVWYGFYAFGDHILFSFDPHTADDRTYWRVDRCGGEPEVYAPLAPGLHNVVALDTAEGPLLYANDDAGAHWILDRLDVPGDDAPRPVLGLPPGRFRMYTYAWEPQPPPCVLFYRNGAYNHGDRHDAAGVGDNLNTVYSHAGDPDAPALHLGDDILVALPSDGQLLVHHDSGTLERVDPTTGARELLHPAVRAFTRAPDGRRLIWQALGDDIAEPVYLHDLAAGTDREIAVNDFAAQSWTFTDNGEGIVGRWYWTGDGATAALVGPDGALVEALDIASGAPIELPEHLGLALFGVQLPDALDLRLADPDQQVRALWYPATGELRPWYRGPAKHARLTRVDGDRVEYLVPDATDPNEGSLWRADLGTGEAHELLPRIGGPIRLDDRHYFTLMDHQMVDDATFSHGAFYTYDLVLADADTHALRRYADDVSDFTLRDGALTFLDVHGEDPGLWAVPLP